jgi:hypothetical protein
MELADSQPFMAINSSAQRDQIAFYRLSQI